MPNCCITRIRVYNGVGLHFSGVTAQPGAADGPGLYVLVERLKEKRSKTTNQEEKNLCEASEHPNKQLFWILIYLEVNLDV